MSSLKHIMDVDVEPLDSQAYRRAREASRQQASHQPVTLTSASSSPTLDDIRGHESNSRRRSERVSKAGYQPPSPRQPSIQPQHKAVATAMDFSSGFHSGGNNQSSNAGASQQSSPMGSQLTPTGEVPVKYTPVTGRISRAKKGVPVHTCYDCRPVKTFTRAEHLRRHQLGHSKPAYPCKVRGCDRAFHRVDLLTRHQNRHEIVGDKAHQRATTAGRRQQLPESSLDSDMSTDYRSSSPTGRRTPPLKVEPPPQPHTHSGDTNIPESSPTDSDITPRTTASVDDSMTAYSNNIGSFPPASFSSPITSHKRTATQAQLESSDPYAAMSPTSRAPSAYDHLAAYPTSTEPGSSGQGQYSGAAGQDSFGTMYDEGSNAQFQNFNAPIALPMLQIPEPYMPSLSYTQDNSPFCSSASDSNYSAHSEGSRNGRMWSNRARSTSVNTPDWAASIPQFSAHSMITSNEMRNTSFDMVDQFEAPYTSARMTPPTSNRQLLDVPIQYGYPFLESSVGTSTLPNYNKPMAQVFSASTSRVPDTGLAGVDRRYKVDTVHQLGSLTLDPTLNSSYPQQSSQLDTYIDTYWQSFNKLFPIIHSGTFNSAQDLILSHAMAAIGTQYHNSAEARSKGVKWNNFCKQSIAHCTVWTLKTMQAILLTEIFARFRGYRTKVSLSKQFEELYNRLLQNAAAPLLKFRSQASVDNPIAENLHHHFSPHSATPTQHLHRPDMQQEWMTWVEDESQRRLLSACFLFDSHQSIYFEQNRSKPQIESSLICLPCPDELWNASCASEWQAQPSDYPAQRLDVIEQNATSQQSVRRTFYTQSLLICHLATRIPARDTPGYPDSLASMHPAVMDLGSIFPNSPLVHSYLALYYTPLKDLLAVAGDTWVLGQKLAEPKDFYEAQGRLKAWSGSMAAATATLHACQVLRTAFTMHSLSLVDRPGQEYTGTPFDISDYWALYVSTLICWAFGHPLEHQMALRQRATGGADRSNSATISHNSSMEVDSPEIPSDTTQVEALMYLNGMLKLTPNELLKSSRVSSIKASTGSLIDAVKEHLERGNIGSQCMTINDCIRNLARNISRKNKAKFF